MTLEEFLTRFNRVRKAGKECSAECPAHDDKKNSLSVREEDGRILVHCHAGCDIERILAAVSLTKGDLFTSNGNGHGAGYGDDPIIHHYVYTDENGEPLFRVCRTASKNFKAQRYEAGVYHWGINSVRRVLYNLPAVIKSKSVLLVEGEKDADRLNSIGLVATTSSFGAGKWSDDYAPAFKGKRVAILADNDDAGRRHAWQVARSIILVAETVKLIEQLPGLPEKGDVSDFLKDHSKGDLLKIIKDAKPLTAEEINSRTEEKPDEWPEPRPIQAQLYPVPAFDPEILLPEALRVWVIDEAERMPCPPDFIAAAAIVGAGAVIGARCAVKPKAKDDWLIVPNVWGGNVGIPSEKKSPAQISATRPIDKLIVLAKEHHKAKLIDFDAKNVIFVAEKEALEYTIKSKAREKYSKAKIAKLLSAVMAVRWRGLLNN